jgi:predicted permease
MRSVWAFFGARGQATVKGALLKILKLPVIYAIVLGLLYNLSGFDLPDAFLRYWEYAIGAWVFIGMMIIGIALSKLQRLELDWKLTANLFAAKFIAWPLAGFTMVLADMHIFGLFSLEVYQLIVIITAVPLAGNLVAYAATLNLHPEKAAAAVLVSTVLGIFTVPAAVVLLQLIS